jgi:hypothetical protein
VVTVGLGVREQALMRRATVVIMARPDVEGIMTMLRILMELDPV